MSEFTPGPWTLEMGLLWYITASGEIVAVVDEDNPADAHLIAAAPELYGALVYWDNHYWAEHDCFGPDRGEDGSEDGCLLCFTRASLTKARGNADA